MRAGFRGRALSRSDSSKSGSRSGRRPPVDVDMTGMRRDAGDWVSGQVETAFLCAMRVGVERDVGDRIGPTGEPIRLSEPLLHDRKRPVSRFLETGEPFGRTLRRA